MKPLTKSELMKLIDSQLPDDALVLGFSSVMYEPYELDTSGDTAIFVNISDTFPEDDMPDGLGDATHLLTSE